MLGPGEPRKANGGEAEEDRAWPRSAAAAFISSRNFSRVVAVDTVFLSWRIKTLTEREPGRSLGSLPCERYLTRLSAFTRLAATYIFIPLGLSFVIVSADQAILQQLLLPLSRMRKVRAK
jgi:hypothetical protein